MEPASSFARAALTLLPYATLLVDKADEVEALFAEAGEGRAGTLAVGANRRFGIYVLSRRLMHMKRRMPAIETSLMIEDNDVVEDAVASHLIDVGFISGRPSNPHLDGFPCFEDRFAFVVGLGSPLMSAYVTARELSDATWVLEREQRTQRDVLAHLEARGIRIRTPSRWTPWAPLSARRARDSASHSFPTFRCARRSSGETSSKS